MRTKSSLSGVFAQQNERIDGSGREIFKLELIISGRGKFSRPDASPDRQNQQNSDEHRESAGPLHRPEFDGNATIGDEQKENCPDAEFYVDVCFSRKVGTSEGYLAEAVQGYLDEQDSDDEQHREMFYGRRERPNQRIKDCRSNPDGERCQGI